MTLKAHDYETGKDQAELDENYDADLKHAPKFKYPAPKKPALRPHPLNDPRYPAAGYNAVLYPLRGMALKRILLQLGNDYSYSLYEQLVRDKESTNRGKLGTGLQGYL